MALITAVNINNTRLKAEATSLPIQVVGDSSAVFSVQVTRSSDGQFYNFTTKAFAAATTSQSRLKNQRPGTFSIAIPAAENGDTYTIIIMAEPHYDTRLSIGNGIRYATTITQVANTTITFTTDTSISTISATAIDTSTGSIIDSFTSVGSPTVTMANLQLTVPDATGDYGVFITNADDTSNNGSWGENALYWSTTENNSGGTAADSDQVVVADVTGLVIGMELTYITGTTAPGSATTITAVNTDTKTLTLSRNQAITDGHTMTFRAYGPRLIQNAIGIGLSLTNPTCKLGQTSTTVRTAITSGTATVLQVNGTTGISVGATVRCRFINKSTDTNACKVSGMNPATVDDGDGQIEIENGRFDASKSDINTATIVYIDGSSNVIYLSGTIHISKYPSVDQNIYIDTSKIFTIGTAS
jgi:hypothetical protein